MSTERCEREPDGAHGRHFRMRCQSRMGHDGPCTVEAILAHWPRDIQNGRVPASSGDARVPGSSGDARLNWPRQALIRARQHRAIQRLSPRGRKRKPFVSPFGRPMVPTNGDYQETVSNSEQSSRPDEKTYITLHSALTKGKVCGIIPRNTEPQLEGRLRQLPTYSRPAPPAPQSLNAFVRVTMPLGLLPYPQSCQECRCRNLGNLRNLRIAVHRSFCSDWPLASRRGLAYSRSNESSQRLCTVRASDRQSPQHVVTRWVRFVISTSSPVPPPATRQPQRAGLQPGNESFQRLCTVRASDRHAP